MNGHPYRPLPFDRERARAVRARRRRVVWLIVAFVVAMLGWSLVLSAWWP